MSSKKHHLKTRHYLWVIYFCHFSASLFAQNTYIGPADRRQGILNFNTDIHVHISLRPYNMSYPLFLNKEVNLWEEYIADTSSIIRWTRHIKKAAGMPVFSSGNLDDLVKGNVRLVFASICPIEWEFTQPKIIMRILSDETKLNNTIAFYAGADH